MKHRLLNILCLCSFVFVPVAMAQPPSATDAAAAQAAFKQSKGYDEWQKAIKFAAGGNVVDAEKSLKRTLELDPQLHPARGHLGSLYLQLGRYAESVAQYQFIAKSNPNNPEALRQLGVALYQADRKIPAIEVLRKAVKLAPKSMQLRKDLGTLLLETNNIMEASGLYEETCLLYTSPSPRDATLSRMPSSA